MEGTRWRELAKLVTNHVFRHVHRDRLVAVMNAKSVTDELRQNRGATRPGFDRKLLLLCVHRLHLLDEVLVDEWTFFN